MACIVPSLEFSRRLREQKSSFSELERPVRLLIRQVQHCSWPGLLFAQILKVTGASKGVLAVNKGKNTQIAHEIGAADEHVELKRDRGQADAQQKLTHFDAVIEATCSTSIVNVVFNYVGKGEVLLLHDPTLG
ncbi:hypothetical protein EV421DRAFT_1437579 [Armillaria borealis]|uniref:Alcohol dehydrogenase-like C-terminal domain-containing protein n=1 Tax=Armillaria borealis TaxID=47425 RepID=A0AA39J0P3_9AGAR|nr:hypothetical protein EV421DRAFT_1437579 [Armillaria borealis]